MKKSELKELIKNIEETISHWEGEDDKEPHDALREWCKGYTSGYKEAVQELKVKFKL